MAYDLKVEWVSCTNPAKREAVENEYKKELLARSGGVLGAMFHLVNHYRSHEDPHSKWNEINNLVRARMCIHHMTPSEAIGGQRFVVLPIEKREENEPRA